ncbi:9196_t:CDS:2 [Paraglomus brasilianum]|uniref:9196_t:CDS:1 n=1 Tax=Paraglomus brasilianum TaxID=144538 RepID=A0A9N9D2F4_9GLOM|nr:9196_t:CDS:2 [Paraglomus brasilianum]
MRTLGTGIAKALANGIPPTLPSFRLVAGESREPSANYLEGVMLKKAEMTYVAYFATCLEELADSSKTPEEWATEHTKRN